MEMFRFLYLDFNSYFASVEQQERPELRGRPLIVVPLESDYTCAIAASYEAKAFGIKTGTMVKEAKRLCPNLAIVQADHERYVAYHERALAVIERHIPVHQVASIDEVACELMGKEREESRARALALAIKSSLARELGACVTCSIGIAENRLLAKIASDLKKPDGLTFLPTDQVYDRLKHLSVQEIPGIGFNMTRRLEKHLVFTIADLWKLAPKHMRAIWHSLAGEQLYYQLRGLEIPDAPTNKRTVGHSHVLAPEWRVPEAAYIIAQRLCLKAAMRLRRYGMRARFLDVGIRTETERSIYFRAQFEGACDNHQIIHGLSGCWHEWQRGETRPHVRIKKLSVTLHGLEAADIQQASLFETSADNARRARMEALSSAMDTLNHRYGRDTVLLGMLPHKTGFTGTKIAFSRVPDRQEFIE